MDAHIIIALHNNEDDNLILLKQNEMLKTTASVAGNKCTINLKGRGDSGTILRFLYFNTTHSLHVLLLGKKVKITSTHCGETSDA